MSKDGKIYIEQRPRSPFWYANFPAPDGSGRRVRLSTKQTEYNAALKEAIRLEEAYGKELSTSFTLYEAFAKYLKEHAKGLASEKDVIGYIAVFTSFFGKNVPFEQITNARISSFVFYLRTEKENQRTKQKGISTGTINRYIQFFRAVHHKMRDEWDKEVAKINFKPFIKKENNVINNYPSRKQFKKLLKAAKELAEEKGNKINMNLYTILRIVERTGLRKGNIVNGRPLTWKQIDFEKNKITVFVKDKNCPEGRWEEIHLPQDLKEYLLSIDRTCDYVVHNNGKPISDFKRSFKSALKRAKLPDYRFHDMRHAFASWLREEGAPLEVIREALKHRDKATSERYAHIKEDPTAKFIDKL